MTKKDYIEMAKIIARITNAGERTTVARSFADMCARDNPRFDRIRFLTACGIEAAHHATP